MKRVFINLNAAFLCSIVLAAPMAAAASSEPSTFLGGSFASLGTLASAQGQQFLEQVTRRQNKIHSFSNDAGRSEVFFGEEDSKAEDKMNTLLDYFSKQLNMRDDMEGALPQVWTQSYKQKGKVSALTSDQTYNYDLSGFAGGVDVKLKSWTLGFSGGYAHAGSDFESLASQTGTAVDAFHGAFYSSYERESATIDSVISFHQFNGHSKRVVADAPALAQATTRSYQAAWAVSAMGHTNWDGLVLTPVAGFTFAALRNGGLSEHGADTLNLSERTNMRYSFKPKLGVDMAKIVQVDETTSLTPEIYGLVQYETLDANEKSHAFFSDDNQITINHPSVKLTRTSAHMGACLAMHMGQSVRAKIQLDHETGVGLDNTSARVRFSAAW